MAFLDESGLSTVVSNIKDKFLAKSGGTITGKIITRAGGSWITARDRAQIYNSGTDQGSYFSFCGGKTNNGAWTIGHEPSGNRLVIAYTSDSDYSAGNNRNTGVLYIGTDGNINTCAANVTNTVQIAHGGTGATGWLAARQNLGVYSSTSAPSNQSSSWNGTIWVQY